MKKLIALILVVCLISVVFTSCRAGSDRAENNGIVTDDTTKRTDTSDKTTTDRNDGGSTSDHTSEDTNSGDTSDGGILDDAGDAVSDAVRGATDAVDDILGGGRDTRN